MTAWTCPRCDRPFGRANRPHVCEPGMPVELWLDALPEPHRKAGEKVVAIARRYTGLIVEAVTVGVLIKRDRTLVELRPKQRWLELSFVSTAAIASPKISKTLRMPNATVYYVRLYDATSVDADLRAWLGATLRQRQALTAR
jgi:hypothetical protein